MRRKKMDAAEVRRLVELLALDRSDLLAELGCRAADVDDGYSYQSIDALSVLKPKKLHDARIYLDGDDVVMIAVPEPRIDPDAVRSLMTGEVTELRSRQGKRAMIELAAADGLAFSRDDDEIGFLEVFPPTTEADYRERIWFDPGAFTK